MPKEEEVKHKLKRLVKGSFILENHTITFIRDLAGAAKDINCTRFNYFSCIVLCKFLKELLAYFSNIKR